MSEEYYTNLQCHDFDTFDSYLRERIRRGLRAGYNYFSLQYHLHQQFGTVYNQYVQNLAQQTQEEEEDSPNR